MCSRLEITPGFFLLVLMGCCFMDAVVVFLTLPAAALHELAHYAALRLCGAEIGGVRLTVFGAEMPTEGALLSYGQEFFCAAAGPLCNILFAALFSCFAGQNRIFALWAGIHAVLAAFNLLPFEASDGGRMLHAMLCAWCGVETGERISQIAGFFCGSAVLVFSVWVFIQTGGNGFLLLGAVGLLLPVRKRYL